MRHIQDRKRAALWIAVIVIVAVWTTPSLAYDQWSVNGDNTNCRACHGDFRSQFYTSDADGQLWGNLHNIHRQDMLGGDCDTCHGSSNFPVVLNQSVGGDGLAAIGCVGCHGRAEDDTAANPDFGTHGGYGAGLRQQHHTAGETVCATCHQDADPANYTVATEDVLPPYYADPGNNHPAMPTGPCNDDGSEDFAGLTTGLDNDGDALYDGDDGDCSDTGTGDLPSAFARLAQNVPNPFNPETSIPFELYSAGWVKLNVYDVSGGLIRKLVDSRYDQAGSYSVRWDGRDQRGRSLPSGVYYYRLEFAGFELVGKTALLK